MKSKSRVNQSLCIAAFSAFFVLLQGCVAVQSFPTVARAGDTVTLALGSVDGLNKSNLQIFYTPQSTGIPVNLTTNIRSVFKVYPDKTSRIWLDTLDSANILNVYSGHGAWLNVAVLNLPLSLPTGPGYYRVVFGSGVVVPNTTAAQSVETVQIGAEILSAAAGTGGVNEFDYYSVPGLIASGDLSRLVATESVVLRPRVSNVYVSPIMPAAAEYRIKLPILGDPQLLDSSSVHVIWDDKPGEFNKQIQLSWRLQNDEITVNVLIPGASLLSENLHRFSIIVLDANGENAIDSNGTPQLLSHRYFDSTGSVIASAYEPDVVLMK